MALKDLLAFDNWAELILQRLVFRRTHLQVHRLNGLEMLVDHRTADAGSIRLCIARDMYSRFLPLLHLDAPANVLDIGANVGGFSLLLCARGISLSKLVCVEMNPNTYERLRFNIRNNARCPNEVLNAAVCAAKRKIQLNLGLGSTADSIYRDSSSDARPLRNYTVEGVSLDDIAHRYFPSETIDICKIDIEGAEDEVILHPESANTSLNRCRYLIIELHHMGSCPTLVDALSARGLENVSPAGPATPGCHLFVNRNLVRHPG